MDKVTVNRHELLNTVKSNRANHEDEFKKLRAAYHQACINWCRGEADRLEREGGEIEYKSLPRPQSHIKEYNLIVQMLEMSVEEEIELTHSQFARYVMDQWEWSEDFGSLKTMYRG